MCETVKDYLIRLAIGNTSNVSNTEQEKRDDQSTCTVTLKSPGSQLKDRRKCKNDDPRVGRGYCGEHYARKTSFGPRASAERLPRARCSLSLRDVSTVSAHPTQSDAVAICGVYLELLKHSVKKTSPAAHG